MKYLLAILLSINLAFADEAVHLLKDTEEKANKIQDMSLELKSYLRINDLLTEENGLVKQRLEASKEHAKFLTDQVNKIKNDSLFPKMGYFVLGAGLAGVVSYGVAATTKHAVGMQGSVAITADDTGLNINQTDRQLHMAVSAASTFALTEVFRSLDYPVAPLLAGAVVLNAGLVKEAFDGQFSAGDMKANALGVGAAMGISLAF